MKFEYGMKVWVDGLRGKGVGRLRRWARDPHHPDSATSATFEVEMEGRWFRRFIWTSGYNCHPIEANFDKMPELK